MSVSDDARRDPERRARSRAADAARKKQRRQIAAEEKRLQKTMLNKNDLSFAKTRLENMKQELANSYYDKKQNKYLMDIETYKNDVEGFAYYVQAKGQRRVSSETGKPVDKDTQVNLNIQFTHQINSSTRKGGVSSLRGEETHMFYQTTVDAWRGKASTGGINSAIMQRSGISDLQQVYDMLMRPEEWVKEGGEGNEEMRKTMIEDLLSKFKYDVSYDKYVKKLKKAKDRFPMKTVGEDGTMPDTSGLPKDKNDKEGSPDFLEFWGSFLDSISKPAMV